MPMTVEQYLRPEIIQQVQRLDLKARFIVEGLLAGLHSSPFHGFSVEFSEHRKYTPGDDIRQIDWNVYARTDRYYIRKFQAETNMDAYLLVDCSGSMNYSAGGRMTKMDYAICLAAALGYLMIHQQDSVGLYTFGEKVISSLPPRSKRSHLMQILATLARTQPAGPTNLADSLHEIAAKIKKKCLIILLSDLLGDQKHVVDALHHLKFAGHDMIVFQVLDRSEVDLDFDGHVLFEDPETGLQIDAHPPEIRRSYQDAIRKFIDEYRQTCLSVKADFVTVNNSMTFDKALVEFLIQRSGR